MTSGFVESLPTAVIAAAEVFVVAFLGVFLGFSGIAPRGPLIAAAVATGVVCAGAAAFLLIRQGARTRRREAALVREASGADDAAG